jgi:hypothetical protein
MTKVYVGSKMINNVSASAEKIKMINMTRN